MSTQIKPLVLAELQPALNATLVTDGSSLAKLKTFIDGLWKQPEREQRAIGVDTETNITPDFFFRKVRTIQLGNRDEQYVIDLLAFADGNEEKLRNAQGQWGKHNGIFRPVLDIIEPVINGNTLLKVGTNLRFEYECFCWSLGIPFWDMFSIDLAERVIVAGAKSLKNYGYFSLESLMERYFNIQIDKGLQQSFDLKTPLTEMQVAYAALDTRLPMAVRSKQLQILDKDNLATTTMLENDSLGTFTDMHINGQRMDCEKWIKRVEKEKAQLVVVAKQLDTLFIPVVGRVSDIVVMKEHLASLEKEWRDFAIVTAEETALSAQIRATKDPAAKELLRKQKTALEDARKEKKEDARTAKGIFSKRLTVLKKIAEKAQGEALINLNSRDQLRDTLLKMKIKGVTDKTLVDTSDETFEKLAHLHPVMQTLRDMRGLQKQIGTYGMSWVTPWTTGPKAEEGWLHPGDGRLHCTINQLDAATGRSTGEKPNPQNLPQDPEVRACFIADPPDEEEPEGYSILTLDMAGAELRIIAELAQAITWIQAFKKSWDVHSVSTEILYPDKWPLLQLLGGEKLIVDGKEKVMPPCAYFHKDHQKCKCPEHEKLRGGTKSTNFLLCYGGTAMGLAQAIGCTVDEAEELMGLHENKFPDIWDYLKEAGEIAGRTYEARTMFGRRRLFLRPSLLTAEAFYRERFPERLELPKVEQQRRLDQFFAQFKRKPTNDEKELLLYRKPDSKQIQQAIYMMKGSIERRGKNHGVQGTNADIAKRAIGCGFDKDGKPYLWHLAKQFKAKFLNFVHDEVVTQVPTRLAQEWAKVVGDAIRRAAAEVMKQVVMESEFHIAHCWQK